jgi:hypothetical protein
MVIGLGGFIVCFYWNAGVVGNKVGAFLMELLQMVLWDWDLETFLSPVCLLKLD